MTYTAGAGRLGTTWDPSVLHADPLSTSAVVLLVACRYHQQQEHGRDDPDSSFHADHHLMTTVTLATVSCMYCASYRFTESGSHSSKGCFRPYYRSHAQKN